VEYELAFAKTGSEVPECLHGIWWMDQFWQSSIAQDPSFRNELPFRHTPSEETLCAFGDYPTKWHPKSLTLGPIPNGGGGRGHWTYLDNGIGTNTQLLGSSAYNMFANLVFDDERMEHIVVDARIQAGPISIGVPASVFQMTMQRRPWGWARVTKVGPDTFDTLPLEMQSALKKCLPDALLSLLEMGSEGAMQYPVLQIVDGNGRRTKYYDEYLKWVNFRSLSKGTHQVGSYAKQHESCCYAGCC